MKKLFLFLCLFIGTLCAAQQPYIKVLPKDCVYTVPVKRVVVMDERTFGKYHYYREHYDTLKELVMAYNMQLVKADSAYGQVTAIYQEIIKSKESEINTCNESREQIRLTLETSMEETRRLQVEFKKYEEKYRKKERWNRFWKITSGVLAATTIVLIVK